MTIDLDRLDEFEKRIAAAVGIRDDQMRHELAEFVATSFVISLLESIASRHRHCPCRSWFDSLLLH